MGLGIVSLSNRTQYDCYIYKFDRSDQNICRSQTNTEQNEENICETKKSTV